MHFSDLGIFLGNISLWEIDYFTKDPMKAQKHLLKKIVNRNKNCEYGKKIHLKDVHSIEDYQRIVPLSTYDDYAPYVDRMINNREDRLMFSGRNIRYCSSSGSVGKPKIVPKSVSDLWKMQCIGFSVSVAVANRWLVKHKNQHLPKSMGPLVLVLTGKRLADGKRCNGAAQIPLTYLKTIIPFFCTSPYSLLEPEHEEEMDMSYLQLRFALEHTDVCYIGSMVITLLTTMFDYLEDHWEMLCDDIEHGTLNPSIRCTPELRKKYEKKFKPNPKRAAELRAEFEKGFDTPIAPRIWPKLMWAYGMMGSSLSIYIAKLRRALGEDIPLHNMGYAAAEGFFATPVELNANDSCLLPHSVFFEFLPIEEGEDRAKDDVRPLLMNEVEVGKNYELVISNLSGLYRYKIADVVHITKLYNNTPRVELMYRQNLSMNVANEKTTTQMVESAAIQTSEDMQNEFVGFSYYADFSTKPPRYCLLIEPKDHNVSEEQRQAYIDALDRHLADANEKYDKYRRWGMLNRPEVLFLKSGTYWDYREQLRADGVVLNQIKPVTVINNDKRKFFFFSHVETESALADEINAQSETASAE
ncbi:MAG: GH3 auxin-responsive promoter family protein [Clostridia bacterium]|nr:GH3 auxin-responsive promoter family protein [Clostridia bacterium]